jgi:GntR family transcriptional regulator / MocR family aminotransferase
MELNAGPASRPLTVEASLLSALKVVGTISTCRDFDVATILEFMREVSEGISPVIALNRAAGPLHRQIYEGFRSAILRGDLGLGQRVPSSRHLASELGISRIPVLNGYAQLQAEGYFESRSGSGTFVSCSLPDEMSVCERPLTRPVGLDSGPRPVARRCALLPGRDRDPWLDGWGAFGVHQPALEQFPFRIWSNLVARHLRSPRISALRPVDPLGSERFRKAVCTYVRTARAVQCEPDQVMIVGGSQQALDITARVLFDPGNAVWVEDPGYRLGRTVFLGAGCRLIPVPVDSDGLNVAAGIRKCRKARAAYVTPSHQYPLGATMTASRRLQLLNWAQTSGAWIIEDDYDSEYRYESLPVASLQGLDQSGRVIYIGTFSKVLFPSLRLGFVVIPRDLVERFIAVRYATDIFPPYLNQEVVADFMCEGHFARHVRRMRCVYGERRTTLVESIHKEFGSTIEVHGAEAGMHLAVTLPPGFRDQEIAAAAAPQGLWLWPLSPTYVGEPSRQGFILGFGSTTSETIPTSVRRLRSVLSSVPA